VLKNVLVLLVSSASATRTKTRMYPGGTIQTKLFIHDVNQQVGQAQRLNRNSIKWSTGHIPVFTTAKLYLGDGGDRRDRTDDLKLAKLPLYQLSYVPSLLLPKRAGYVPRRILYGGPGKT
jgi:hypothetical protein